MSEDLVGTRWRSRDIRDNGRIVEVVRVHDGYAQLQNVATRRVTHVRLELLRPQGRRGWERVR